jgi:UPF0755 protein
MTQRTPPRKRNQKPRRRGLRAFAVLLFVILPLGLLGWGSWVVTHPYQGYTGPFQDVAVPNGMGAARILDRLADAGVVADARLARLYLVYALRNPRLQAGEYRFSGPLTLREVLRKLERGDVVFHPVTLVEGLSLEESAAALAHGGAGREQVLLNLLHSPQLVADLDPEATDLEGYVFPETYRFAAGISEVEVVALLVRTFRDRALPKIRALQASAPGGATTPRRPLREIVTLASIVEKEAKAALERPLIAGVYANRLRLHIALDADPTVIFGLKRLGRWTGTIHKADLSVVSPYNTYRVAGLPPGPICSPGLASLEAATQPSDIPYLYFVSRNDGTHVFASTLAEHNRNVDIWQKRYWREKRQEQNRAIAGASAPPSRR